MTKEISKIQKFLPAQIVTLEELILSESTIQKIFTSNELKPKEIYRIGKISAKILAEIKHYRVAMQRLIRKYGEERTQKGKDGEVVKTGIWDVKSTMDDKYSEEKEQLDSINTEVEFTINLSALIPLFQKKLLTIADIGNISRFIYEDVDLNELDKLDFLEESKEPKETKETK